jgi:hypothetical protein
MSTPAPSVGRIVHYALSQHDAETINRGRRDAHLTRKDSDTEPRTGYVAHEGNHTSEGDVFPAVIVRVWNETVVTVNLHVLLDGSDTHWATSIAEGAGPGRWAWPERV